MAISSHRFSIFALLSIVSAAAVAFARDVAHAIERGVDRLIAIFPLLTREPTLAIEGYTHFAGQGDPLPRSLLNDLRHEAGMRTRAAARHT